LKESRTESAAGIIKKESNIVLIITKNWTSF